MTVLFFEEEELFEAAVEVGAGVVPLGLLGVDAVVGV